MSGENTTPQNRFVNNKNPGKRFQKGVSGNPGGRPKGAVEFATLVREFLHQKHPKKPDKTQLMVLVERLIIEDPKTLLAYAYGKPVETNVLQSGGEGALQIVVHHANEIKT